MDLEQTNDHFGQINRRSAIPTPALTCDLDKLNTNIARMGRLTAAAGVALRPHVKSHKSAFIARLQLEAGARGLCCAKIAEAEAVVERLALDGYPEEVSILITSPVVGAEAARRLVELAAHCDLAVVVDHPSGVDELDRAATNGEVRLKVLCDVDVGLGRTGVTGPAEALAVAERVDTSASLDFAGVQGYGGHLQHVVGRSQRIEATRVATQRLSDVIDALESAGHEVGLRTGGGTGTFAIDMEIGLFNELQAGSYVFMDREYRDALGADVEGDFQQSLTIATTVISANHDGYVTVDAGLKAMATDAGPPWIVGHEESVQYAFFGDEHGLVTNAAERSFARGDRIELVPPHCDPTVDRYDFIWLVRGDDVVGIADVVARGCSQ